MAEDGARAGAVHAEGRPAGSGGPADGADERVDVLIVGAGPCGLAAAIACEREGLSTTILERGCLVSGIYGYPTFMTFFSTADRLSIGGIPFTVATEKPTRRDALAYYRAVTSHFGLRVRQYEEVVEVASVGTREPSATAAGQEDVPAGGPCAERKGGARDEARAAVSREERMMPGADAGAGRREEGQGGVGRDVGAPPESSIAEFEAGSASLTTHPGAMPRPEPPPRAAHESPPSPSLDARFRVRSRTRSGRERVTSAHAVVIATGYFGHPNRLGVPGEQLPHVTHLFREGHEAFQLPVVVVGGGNSAVDAALDLYRAGAHVTMVHFGPELDPNVKPWVRPDVVSRIREGSIAAHFESRVAAIEPEHVVLRTPAGELRVPALAVYTMLGYQPNNALLTQLRVPMDQVTGIPAHDPASMETAVRGVYIAGVLASGYDANKTFIENGRHHGDLIARHLRSPRGARRGH